MGTKFRRLAISIEILNSDQEPETDLLTFLASMQGSRGARLSVFEPKQPENSLASSKSQISVVLR
jgi:hypothetical protein